MLHHLTSDDAGSGAVCRCSHAGAVTQAINLEFKDEPREYLWLDDPAKNVWRKVEWE